MKPITSISKVAITLAFLFIADNVNPLALNGANFMELNKSETDLFQEHATKSWDTNTDKTRADLDKIEETKSSTGMEHINIKKNIINGKNVLTQNMVMKSNTIYIIQYDYDLNGAKIIIPEGCVLDFQGGSLSNGNIVGTNSQINAGLTQIFSFNITLSGSWRVAMAYPEWFGAKGDGETDDATSINKCIETFANNRTNIFLGRNYAVSNIVINKSCMIIGTPFTRIIHIGKGVCIDITPPDNITSWNQFIRTKIFDLNIFLNNKSSVGLRINQCIGSLFERIFITGANTSIPIIDKSTSPEKFKDIKSRGVYVDGTSDVEADGNSVFNNIFNRVVANKVDIGFDINGIISDSKFYNIESNSVGEGLRITTKSSHNVSIIDCQFVETNIAINIRPSRINCIITGCNLELYKYYGIYKAKHNNGSIISIIKNGATTKYNTKISDFRLFTIREGQISSNLVGWGSNKSEEEKTPSEKSNIDGDFYECLVFGNKSHLNNPVKYPKKAINMNFMFGYDWVDNKDCTVIKGNTNIKHPIVDNIRLINKEHGALFTLKGDRSISVKMDSGTEAFIPYGAADTSVAKNAIVGTMIYNTTCNRPIWRNTDWQWREIDGCVVGTPRSGTKTERPTVGNHAIKAGFVYFDTDLNKPIWWTGTQWVDATGAKVP